jgi:hypothetical protein
MHACMHTYIHGEGKRRTFATFRSNAPKTLLIFIGYVSSNDRIVNDELERNSENISSSVLRCDPSS